MRLRLLFFALLFCGVAQAEIISSDSIFGSGAAAPAYQGPGDVYSTTPLAAYSCARAFTASWASGGGNACLIQRLSDSVQCTTKFTSSGFVDLTTAYCNSNTQTLAQFCNATTCRVMTAYDMSGNARDATQATFASAPVLTLSSSPRGTLPVITCSGTVLLASAAITRGQPISLSSVLIVTTGGSLGGAIGGNSTTYIGQPASANNLSIVAGASLSAAATDNTWHSLNATESSSTLAINVDGSDSTAAATSSSLSTLIRVCRAAGSEFIGSIAEAAIWGSQTNSTQRGAVSTNQHDATNGYNF